MQNPVTAPDTPSAALVDHAAERAVGFLLAGQGADGSWEDFDVRGTSNGWITGYVGGELAGAGRADAAEAARRGWRWLAAAGHWETGWGYRPGVPADGDSTAWGLRLAERLGEWDPALAPAVAFLERHQSGEGGVCTYLFDGPVRTFLPNPVGWCSPHGCVTAAAAGVEAWGGRHGALDYLRARQRHDGSWDGYWWCDREYTTALAAEALARSGHASDAARVRAAAAWAAGRVGDSGAVATEQEPEGSPFATALAARVLALGEAEEARAALERAVGWLLREQREDGGWNSSAWLRQAPSEVVDPDAYSPWRVNGRGREMFGSIFMDTRAVFTTATVLGALTAFGGTES